MVSVIALLLAVTVDQAPPAAAAPASPTAATAPAAPVLPAEQIAAAILAAPADRRAGAQVLGYDDKGALVTLREGTNDQVCLADNPKENGISVACYHKDLEPFMTRGRALAAENVKNADREDLRAKEIAAGTLKMSKEPRSLCVVSGTAFDAATGTIAEAYTRWVVYTPFATPESTGLSVTPVPGGPWLMYPGKGTAHIMINPARPPKR
ncbi:MAG: hypothetical protein ABIT71_21180 [Vicinamibacteraceae bacterium]